MVKIELNEKEYNLPTDFGEVMLGDYMEVINITKDKNLDEVSKMVSIISIMTGISVDDIRGLKLNNVKMINTNLGFLFQEGPKDLIQKIKIGNKWYGFNKDLNILR